MAFFLAAVLGYSAPAPLIPNVCCRFSLKNRTHSIYPLTCSSTHLQQDTHDLKMPPRIQRIHYSRLTTTIRPYAADFSANRTPLCLRLQQSRRTITADEKPLPEAEQPKGPNQEQLPHVSEEAAATGKITGEGGPELEQGSPVQEVLYLSVPSTASSMTPADIQLHNRF